MSRQERGKGGPSRPPPLLQRLYGEANVVCLRDLLLCLCSLSREAAALPAALVQPHDHADYAQALLERTWCVLREDAPPLRDGFSLSQATGQHQLVGRAVEALLRSGQQKSGGAGSNVLCLGFRKRRPQAGGRNVAGMATAEASHHNSTTSSLCSPAWQLLLSRIGDTLMLYVLLHASMFAELPNACCLQLSGTPISQVARTWRKQAPAAVAAAASRLVATPAAAGGAAAPVGVQAAAVATPATQPASDAGADGPVWAHAGAAQAEEAAAGEAAAAARASGREQREQQPEGLLTRRQEGQAERQPQQHACHTARQSQQECQQQQGQQQQQSDKKARPSSWQRRRAAKLRQAQQAQQAEKPAAGPSPCAMDEDGLTPSEGELPSTEEVEVGPSSGEDEAAPATVPAPAVQHEAARPAPLLSAASDAAPHAGLPAQDRDAAAAPGNAADGVLHAALDPGVTHGGKGRSRGGGGGNGWPARMPRPADMPLQRSPIFYCSSFPQKPGLTSQHILSKLRGAPAGERSLYAAIFDPLHSPVGRAGAARANLQSVVPPPPRRVPAKHRHLLTLLRQMVARAAKCPFSMLLQHHCPLPPHLRQHQQQRQGRQQRQTTSDGGADADADAAAATGRAGWSERRGLPSQGALLQQVRHREQDPAAEARAGTAAAGAPPSVDALMDELFSSEAAEEQAAGGLAGGTATPACMDDLMDELFGLEQSGAGQYGDAEHAGKRLRLGAPAAPPAGAEGGSAAHAATLAGCPTAPPAVPVVPAVPVGHSAEAPATAAVTPAAPVGGQNSGCLPPTQPAPQHACAGAHAQPAGPPLAACFVPHRRVAAFVWAAVRAIVPAAMLGDGCNRRGLRGAISRFVRLRRFEHMSVHQAMQGLRVSGFPWLQPRQGQSQSSDAGADPAPGDPAPGNQQDGGQQRRGRAGEASLLRPLRLCASQHASHQRMLALWLGWLFSVVVVPLLRAHFYCTESEAYRQQVFYYRKPVWAALARAASEELAQQQFAALPEREVLRILQGRRLGVARLRLLPKRSGMRAILNLGAASAVRFRRGARHAGPGVNCQRLPAVRLTFRPVNSLLQNLYQVLRFEASCQPHLLGASVFGYNDAFCKLQPFVRKWRAAAEAAAAGGGALRPLIVSVDVTRAFDNVSIPLLLSLVEPLLRHEQYIVLKYSEVISSLGQVKVLHRRLATAAGAGDAGNEAPPFPQLAQRWAAVHKGKAFADQVTFDRLSRQQALDLLRQHLTASIVRLRRRWCAQQRGIAQGSTLSTLLCSLYLAHLERTQLGGVLDGPLPPPSAPSRGAAGAAGAAAQASVVVLTGGNAATLSPAAALRASGGLGSAGSSSGSRGLLSELARAADSWTTPAQQAQQAQHGPPSSTAGAPAWTPCPASPTERGSWQRGKPGSSGGGGGSSGGRPIGDLLLLPAGATHARGTAAASAAAAATDAAACGAPQAGAAAEHGPAGLAPPPPRGAPAAQQAQQAQQLGCTRLALHAGSLLLRLVDDFLLVTAVPAVAQGFASRMLGGFASHGVFVNPEKTKLSFALQLAAAGAAEAGPGPARQPEVVPAAVWRSGDGATFVKWCGLLINTATLELQGDYTRYAGEHVSTALTLPLRRRPGLQLAARLCHYLRPKIHPLLLDATMNSPQTVRLNIYQAFLLGAMKFHCYVRALPAAPAQGAGLLLDAILAGIGFMRSLARRRRVASAHQPALQAACCTRVPAAHIRWLGLTAFIRVLRAKQARYRQLLAELEELAAAPALRHAARQLAPVVDPARSSAFDCILY